MSNFLQTTSQSEVEGQQLKLKGSQCSVSGGDYEKKIHKVVNNSCIDDKPLNKQKV